MTSTWTGGYISDLNYTFGYYMELSELNVKLSFLNKGRNFPKISKVCELGYGHGLTAAIQSACTGTEWYGTDFLPDHSVFAKSLTEFPGSAFYPSSDSIAEFLSRDDLPQFDLIILHGVWSWVSEDNRRLILRFIEKYLNLGGIVYVSYNTLPGWSAFQPIRDLMKTAYDLHGGLSTTERIGLSLDFVKKTLSTNPIFTSTIPSLEKRFDDIYSSDRNYLAHEFFNENWEPVFFSTMARSLRASRLSYVATATLIEHVDHANLTAKQMELLQGIPDRYVKESVYDLMINQQFRRDLWVKGSQALPFSVRQEKVRELKVVLLNENALDNLKVSGRLGAISLLPEIYQPIINKLQDGDLISFSDLEASLSDSITFEQLLQAIIVLISKGDVSLAQAQEEIDRATLPCQRLNQLILDHSCSSSAIGFVASPVAGRGIPISRIDQLYLNGHLSGLETAESLAKYAWNKLSENDEKLIKDGVRLEKDVENIEQLKEWAKLFVRSMLPKLRRLGVG